MIIREAGVERSILIVDNHPASRNYLANFLKRREFKIFEALMDKAGLTKASGEEIIGVPIKTNMPYIGGNFARANHLNQRIKKKYPTDTASFIFKETAADLVKIVQRLRSKSLA